MAGLDELGSIITRDGVQVSYGTGPNDLLQLDDDGKISASVLSLSGGDIAGVTAGTALTGGGTSGTVTLNVDVGVTNGKIPQMNSTGYPAANGSLITNVAATTATTAAGLVKTSPAVSTMTVVVNEEEIALSGATSDSVANLLPANSLLLGVGIRVTEAIEGAKSQGTITMSGLATAEETFVVGAQTFTWKATRAGAGEVTIGTTAAEACTNIITAITADLATVTAAEGDGDTVVVTAATAGTAGDSLTFTENSTNMAVDGAGTLGTTTAGTDVTTFSVGDASTAARFAATNSTLTANETDVGGEHLEGGVASDAAGSWQVAAAKVRITTDAAAGAGSVRIAVHALSFTAPTS